MGWFSDNFENVRSNVTEALRLLGLDKAGALPDEENEKGALWKITKGSASVEIWVLKVDDDNDGVMLQVEAPVMALPDQNLLPLYRRLLELNKNKLFGASFGIEGSMVVITSERLARAADRVEIAGMIDRVASYADEYDDELTAEFGGVRAKDVA